MLVWSSILLIVCGMMGAGAVAMAAAGAHAGGENLSTAATFLLIHATAAAAIALHPGGSAAFLTAATVLVAGACLFSGDLALRAFAGVRLFPMAAPLGGLGMMAGWLILSGAASLALFNRS
jgi:uncharacterized membrane protein YgdD (TMEM256/DUF423 family)